MARMQSISNMSVDELHDIIHRPLEPVWESDNHATLNNYESSEPQPNDKELILLSVNVGVGNSSRQKAQEQVQKLSGYIGKMLDDINRSTKYYVKAFIISSEKNETNIECIFPKGADIGNVLDIDSLRSSLDNKDTITL